MSQQLYNEVSDWYHSEGDRRTAIAATLRDADGAVVNLTGTTVAFKMVNSVNAVVIASEAATIDSAAAGTVSYSPSAAFAALLAGDYYAWWVVTRTSDSRKDHYPPDGKRLRVRIVDAY